LIRSGKTGRQQNETEVLSLVDGKSGLRQRIEAALTEACSRGVGVGTPTTELQATLKSKWSETNCSPRSGGG
jgi:hypothetical protein